MAFMAPHPPPFHLAHYQSDPLRKTCARLESSPCRTVWRFGPFLHTEATGNSGAISTPQPPCIQRRHFGPVIALARACRKGQRASRTGADRGRPVRLVTISPRHSLHISIYWVVDAESLRSGKRKAGSRLPRDGPAFCFGVFVGNLCGVSQHPPHEPL